MNDAGYTLVETLTALAIIGLAMSGLAAAVQVLAGRQHAVQTAVIQVRSVRAAQAAFDRLFEGQGPYRSHETSKFVGTGQAFAFDCGQAADCQTALVNTPKGAALETRVGTVTQTYLLNRIAPVRFIYFGTAGESAAWPPNAPERQALRSISIVDDANSALIKTKLWLQQPGDCQFDVVLQDCR